MTNLSVHSENGSSQYFIPDNVVPILEIRYHIILPIFVSLTLLVNSFCICVTRRPKLTALHSNIYITMMAFLDLLCTAAYMPFIFDTELCLYENYATAFYHTHFGVHIPNCLKAGTAYVMLSLSYDRFLAIWFTQRYKAISRDGTVKKRLIIGGIWLVLSFVPAMAIGNVSLQSNGLWLGLSGYKYTISDWVFVYKMYLMLIIGILPLFLIIGLNIGLVVGLVKKRIIKHGGNRRNRQFFQTIAVLAINFSYVLCCVPYLITVGFYKRDKGKCYGTYRTEMILLIFNSMVLLWSVINILIFFVLNKDYNIEIWKMLESVPCIQKCIDKRGIHSQISIDCSSENPS